MGHRLSLMGRAVGQHRVPPNTRRSTNAGLLLAHRVRRWTNIKPALSNIFAGVFAGVKVLHYQKRTITFFFENHCPTARENKTRELSALTKVTFMPERRPFKKIQ